MVCKHTVDNSKSKAFNSIKIQLLLILIGLIFFLNANATHNRAGEITYKQISGYTFEITVTTFTNTKPTTDGTIPADRPSLTVIWGDDTYSEVDRNLYIDLPDYYRKNTYISNHTYPGPGTYKIYVEDPNRNEGVENIPNSVLVVFSISTILQINPLLGVNNTPVLLNPPVDKAATYQKFIHNPAAYDPDGDSLSYELTVCTGEDGEAIASYTYPPSTHTPIYIDSVKGDLVWDAPPKAGIYNVAFFINEWRKGVKIGKITRDMQIEVFDSENTPPSIDTIPPICVVAGESLNLSVSAHDSSNETLTLSATGGVFLVDSAASFTSTPSQGTVTGYFKWNTQCLHVRKEPYQVVFKVTDDNDEVSLVDQKTTEITIIGPAPKILSGTSSSNSVYLTWDSYTCTNAVGFKIYRKNDYYGFTPDNCEIGVPGYTGYEQIATVTGPTITEYIDNNNGDGLTQGYTYCYLITAFFDNNLESQASEEYCVELERGIPIITNVSVTKHDETKGEIMVSWLKPNDFDSLNYESPFKYIIKRSDNIYGGTYETIDSLNSLDDTIYFDQNINTTDHAYAYSIEIHDVNGYTEQPMIASSIFPEIVGEDNAILLNLIKNTPWTNYSYTIYKQNPETLLFDSIGVSSNESFTDSELKNGETYCYSVKSYGKYNLTDIPSPLVNYSHQNCGEPVDTIAPSSPTLEVNTNCSTFVNTLVWQIQSNADEVIQYNIYYAPTTSSEYSKIDSLIEPDSLQYEHIMLEYPTGCYAVTALDSNKNESEFSNIVCVDNCSYYELPNIFTPNNDNKNDLYIPITPTVIIDQFIERVDFSVYTRWGNLVYHTNDPHLNWDGKLTGNNKIVTPGVYYYVCDVYEKRISGIEHRNIVGFIHVFYNNNKGSNE